MCILSSGIYQNFPILNVASLIDSIYSIDSYIIAVGKTKYSSLAIKSVLLFTFRGINFFLGIHSGNSVEYMNDHCIWNKWVRNYRRALPSHLTRCQIKLALATKNFLRNTVANTFFSFHIYNDLLPKNDL